MYRVAKYSGRTAMCATHTMPRRACLRAQNFYAVCNHNTSSLRLLANAVALTPPGCWRAVSLLNDGIRNISGSVMDGERRQDGGEGKWNSRPRADKRRSVPRSR
jgi:hypothetical protein